MPTTFRPYQPDQLLMLPESLQDWLPEGHLSQHVSDLVDGLDLRVFYDRYEGDGRRKSPYEPRMMVKVLIYGYTTGVFSSRRLAKKLEEDVAFRVLGAGTILLTDGLRVSAASFGRFQAVVRGSGSFGGRDGFSAYRDLVDRWDEGSRERLQAQGDELWANGEGGEAS